jgi:hypothetical protein
MTNGELIAILQRFPAEGQVKVRQHEGGRATKLEDIDRAEMAIDPTPTRLQAQNIGWSDLIKEKINVVLVWGEPQEMARQAPKAVE